MNPLGNLDDNALIEGTLAGRNECFGVLMNRHTAAVRQRVRAMVRNRSDVDDLVQETFLKAWRHLSAFRFDASFRSWVTRVATNEVLQRYRRDRSNPANPTGIDPAGCISQSESPHEVSLRLETGRAIWRAVAGLPEKYRQVLVLRDLQELTILETARLLRYGVPLVKTRHFRARRMLSAAVLRHAAR